MLTPTSAPSVVLPAQPSMDELRGWMEDSVFAAYKDALLTSGIVPENIRSVKASVLRDQLSLPSLGMALGFRWALLDANWERLGEVGCRQSRTCNA